VALTRKVQNPGGGIDYPKSLSTPARRALYDNLGKDERLAIAVDYAVLANKKDEWRGHRVKEKEVKYAIKSVLHDTEQVEKIFELVKNQREY
jgi:type I restriction enzyme R subunit